MTTRPDLLAIIARLEAAKEGSRELSEEVAVIVLGWCLHKNQEYTGAQSDTGFKCQDCGADSWGNRSRNGLNQRLHDNAPDFTRSVDAALTLVPEGLCWRYDSALGGAQIFDLASSPIEVSESGNAELTSYPPALALCIAALRARLAEKEDGR